MGVGLRILGGRDWLAEGPALMGWLCQSCSKRGEDVSVNSFDICKHLFLKTKKAKKKNKSKY